MTTSPGTEDAAMLAAGVLKRIETENIRNVRLILTDLYGVARGKVVTAARMERAVTEGHPFAIPLFASNLWQRHAPGEHLYSNDIGYRNGVLRLDPLTFAPLPWTPATVCHRSAYAVLIDTAIAICGVYGPFSAAESLCTG